MIENIRTECYKGSMLTLKCEFNVRNRIENNVSIISADVQLY